MVKILGGKICKNMVLEERLNGYRNRKG